MSFLSSFSRICSALAVFFSLASTASALGSPKVTELRVGDYRFYTRFVLDISQKVKFKVFTLADPYRVVIDLPEVSWAFHRTIPHGRRIIGYRFGLFEAGRSRVVIDLKSAVRIKRAFILPKENRKPTRLVVDIMPVKRLTMLQDIAKRRKNRGTVDNRYIQPPTKKVTKATTKVKKKPLILIDPGHGGIDPGALARTGALEKNIVLEYARVSRRYLRKTGRYRVVLTRDKDIFLRLRKRVAMAQEMRADLFISLHADSMKNRRIRGASVYTLSERASDKEAAILAERENKSDIISGIDLNDKSKAVARILIDLRQRLTKNESVQFAEILVNQLSGRVPLLRKNRRYAGFAVLKAPDVPSVLVEMGYLSNSRDELMLQNKQHRRKFARALLESIDKFFIRQRELYSK